MKINTYSMNKYIDAYQLSIHFLSRYNNNSSHEMYAYDSELAAFMASLACCATLL